MAASRPWIAASLALAAGVALAAPTDSATEASDPYELAVRWTLASLSPRELPPLPAPAAPALRTGVLPHAGSIEGGVPDPAAYAALGVLLLGAGLAARRFAATRARRGRR